MTMSFSLFKIMSPPLYLTTCGFTFVPVKSVAVSTCAKNPTVSASTFPGIVANKYPLSSNVISFKPNSSSSSFNIFKRSHCLLVDGVVSLDASDCVSTLA